MKFRLLRNKVNIKLANVQVLLAEWCVIFILLLYPVFASLSIFLGVPSRPISLGYRFIYFFLALLVILFDSRKLMRSKIPSGFFFLAFFWFIYFCRIVFDLLINQYTGGFASRGFAYFFQFSILGTAIPTLALVLVAKRLDYSRLIKRISAISFLTILSLLVVINHEVGLTFNIFLVRTGLGDEGAVISAIILSQYGGLFLIVGINNYIKGSWKVFYILQVIFGLGFLLLGASRGPLVAVLFTIFIIIIYQLKRNFKRFKFWRIGAFLIACLSFLFVRYVLPNFDQFSLLNRLSNATETDYGGEARSLQWSSAWNQFLDNPIFGDLIVERVFNFYPHNLILEILMSMGVLGMVFFLHPFSKLLLTYLNVKDVNFRFLIYVCVLFFMYSLFSLSMIGIPQFWCLLGIIAGYYEYNLYKIPVVVKSPEVYA